METAFSLLREQQTVLAEQGETVTPIDFAYFALLARVQVNLQEYAEALATVKGYSPKDGGGEDLAGTLKLIARESLSQAERAPAATDEEKAVKAGLYQTAVEAGRLWLEKAGSDSTEAQRHLARALPGTKSQEGYEEAVRILTSLWEADPQHEDGSIQLDLASAHAAFQQWELVVASASAAIERNPDDPLGQAYCLRSFAQYRLGNCQEAINDGSSCKNADGSLRALKHVDTCRQRLADQQAAADRALKASQEAVLRRECEYLLRTARWANENAEGISIIEFVGVLSDFKAGQAKCAPYFPRSGESGDGPASLTAALCVSGVKTASRPANLVQRDKAELEDLRRSIEQFSTLCAPVLDAHQVKLVQDGLIEVQQRLRKSY
jgi:tetratricopeptide (TPR) repeat protein